jgi:hypothetical protein
VVGRLTRGLVLVAVPAMLVVAGGPAGAGRAGRADPVVTAAVQVTTNPNPTRAHSSPQVARNPKNGELVIAETDVYGGFEINVHISADNGRSWFPGGDPMMKPFTWNSDYAINGPYFTMAYDRDDTLSIAFSATDPKFADVNRTQRPRSVFLARSGDGGRSFTTSVVYRAQADNPKTVNNRRAMVAVDPKNPANVYVDWIQSTSGEKSRSMVAASGDGGKTFRDPVELAEPIAQGGYQARMAVDSDGVVHAVFPGGGYSPPVPAGQPSAPPVVRPIYYRHSSDQGRTWSPPAEIDPGNAGFSFNRKHLLAFDPKTRNLYLTWYGNANPNADAKVDKADIFVRVSGDGGKTWGDRATVNDDATMPNVQHYDPGISIAPNGRVDLAWYDFRNSPAPEKEFDDAPFNNGGWQDVYYASSSDGGRTWSPNLRVNDRLIDRNIGVWSNNVHSHYNVGITSSNDAVYFAWQDSRNGNSVTNSEDVYSSALFRQPSEVAVRGGPGPGVPRWALFAVSAAVGMGVAMAAAFLATRRGRSGDAARRGAVSTGSPQFPHHIATADP